MGEAAGQLGVSRLAGPRGTVARLWDCIQCGYDLSGLPPTGACPECGSVRREGWLWIAGWPRAKDIPFGQAHAIRVGLGVLLASGLFALPVVVMRRGALLGPTTLALVLAVCAPVVGLFGFVVRRERRRPPPLVVHLTHESLTFKTRRLKDWSATWDQVRESRVRRISRGVYRLRVTYGASRQALVQFPQRAFALAEFTIVFRGSRRDAALVRRVVRRHRGPA